MKIKRLLDWLFPWRVRIRSLESGVIEQARQNYVNRESWASLQRRVGLLEETWKRNFTVYGDANEYDDSHVALFGRDEHGPIVVIRKVDPGDFQEFIMLAKRLSHPARLGGVDCSPQMQMLVNRTWRDTGRVK